MKIKKAHEIDCESSAFQPLKFGIKNFEIGLKNEGYEVGDLLIIREISDNDYTGNSLYKRIVYITDFEQKEGFVVLGLGSVSGIYKLDKESPRFEYIEVM